MYRILLGFGGNLKSATGTPAETITAAIAHLPKAGVQVTSVSDFYQTSPVPASDQPDFINAAAWASCRLDAVPLLQVLAQTERHFGRQKAERWSARTLDIDLLAYGAAVLPDKTRWMSVVDSLDPAATLIEPVVPHPRLHRRGFVLAPLMDIAPDWVHPVLQVPVSTLYSQLQAKGGLTGIKRQK